MTASITDDFLAELEQAEHDMVLEIGRELLADGARVEDLPRLLAPLLALVAQHRAENLSRLQALVERRDATVQ